MTTDLAVITAELAGQNRQTTDLIQRIRVSTDLDDLVEVRARIEAQRAWAKVHGQAKKLRLQLLVVEIEALVRIVELGGLDCLPKRDRRAAQWLASMTVEQRSALIAESGSATTAVGLCGTVFQQQDCRDRMAAQKRRGRDFADAPSADDVPINDRIAAAAARAQDLGGVLHNVLDKWVRQGIEFTVPEIAEQIIEECGIDPEQAGEAFQEGVAEVVRTALRTAPPMVIDGTPIPKVITVRRDGGYVRIPTENATLAHLDDMILMRREQAQQYLDAVQRLQDAADRLREMAAGDRTIRIGALLAQMVVGV